MTDVVGLVISICQVSATLYKYYQETKERDDALVDFRLQLLGLQEKSVLVEVALQRKGLLTDDKHNVKRALERCEQEATRMDEGLEKLTTKSLVKDKHLREMKSFFKSGTQKAKWPFQKSTIMAFSEDVETCHRVLDESIRLLHLSVSVRTIEELRALDDKVTENIITSATALTDIKSGIETAFQRIDEQLSRHGKELSRQTEIISNSITDEEMRTLLLDPDFERRQGQIPDSHDETYDCFTKAVQEYPQAANLLKFLQTGVGIFWISGKAASGKSTLMKHLSNPQRRDGQHLWVWDGNEDCTIARHFCWIAGSDNEKSQSALLRSLLYSILGKGRHLVHIVCQHGPPKGSTYAAWRLADLWFCLHEAIKQSKNRFCLFIDGLDELEETAEFNGKHEDIVTQLIDLSLLPNIKVIVSSRPWTAFHELQTGSNRFLCMETVNQRAILDYWHLNLSKQKEFADVVWPCLYGSQHCYHYHEDGHTLVSTLIEKADGNFLWTSLVANSLFTWLRGGISLNLMRQNIERTPGNLTDYIHDRVLMRTNDVWDTLKPMALKMSVYTPWWYPFWLLRESKLDQLSIAEPGVPFVLTEYTLQEIRKMMLDTIPFLQECCRDILDVTHLVECSEMDDDDFAEWWYDAIVSFTHRSVFDFLQTPDVTTEKPIFNDLPYFFYNEHFKKGLEIVPWTIKPATPTTRELKDLTRIQCCWESISSAIADQSGQSDVSRDLAAKAEQACMYQSALISDYNKRNRRDFFLRRYLAGWCYTLATYDLYALADELLERAPELLCLPTYGLSMLRRIIIERSKPLSTHWKLMEKLLKAGADPNDHGYGKDSGGWSTPWCLFLAILDDLANTASRSSQDKGALVSTAHNTNPMQIADNTSHFSPEIQAVLTQFLESGAELEDDITKPNERCDLPYCGLHEYYPDLQDERIEPMTILRKWLPMDDASGWPAVLQSYMQPSRREELREERRKIRARLLDEYLDI